MTQTNPQCIHLSASAISSFKACPTRFRLSYREGLRLAADTDSQRMGTGWHAMHEEYHAAYGRISEQLAAPSETATIEMAQAYALTAVTNWLNSKYAECPQWKTIEEWGLERTILMTGFIGYLWYYQNDPIEVLASEVAFDLPLHMPKTGLPLPLADVMRVGKIDHVIRWQGMVGNMERKSTSRGIGADSDYWDKAKKDTQVSMYALAFKDMLGESNLLTDAIYGPTYCLPLTQEKWATVDEADRERIEQHTWHANYEHNNWYAATTIDGKRIKLHRFLMGCEEGDGRLIDHVNQNGLDCRRCNLRDSTVSENALNSDKRAGINFQNNRWHARLCQNGNRKYLGCFKTEEEASAAYQAAKDGLKPQTRIGNTLYCVWHKPTIKPAMLSQKDTAEFIRTGEYCGQTFKVDVVHQTVTSEEVLQVSVTVDGEDCKVEMGKKGFAIRETLGMYSARLLADIYERPDFYYQRREIARTDAEIRKFRSELFNIYQAMKMFGKSKCWYENESNCRSTFPCAFIPICYGEGADNVCDGQTTPAGYRRIFVDLKVNGESLED